MRVTFSCLNLHHSSIPPKKKIMKLLLALSSVLIVADAKRFNTWGPVFTVESEGLAPRGVEDLALKGEWSADVTEGVSAGVKYDVNIARNTPSSVWVAVSALVSRLLFQLYCKHTHAAPALVYLAQGFTQVVHRQTGTLPSQ
jgi:hypothetical protein